MQLDKIIRGLCICHGRHMDNNTVWMLWLANMPTVPGMVKYPMGCRLSWAWLEFSFAKMLSC